MNRAFVIVIILASVLGSGLSRAQQSTRKDIYHSGWIDLNKNGRMDVYEDPKADIEHRVTDLLSQMTLEEKT